MADKVATSGVTKEKGYLYYLGKDGNVWRSKWLEELAKVEALKKWLILM